MIRKLATILTVTTATLGTVSSGASAGDWNHGRAAYGHYGSPRAHSYYAPRVAPAPHYYGHYGQHRARSGDKIAKGVAIGVGAVILGTILANEARRNHY